MEQGTSWEQNLHRCGTKIAKKSAETPFWNFKVGILHIWGFPKMVVPNNQGFPTKNDHFGVFGGYHHLRKHPYRSCKTWLMWKLILTKGTFDVIVILAKGTKYGITPPSCGTGLPRKGEFTSFPEKRNLQCIDKTPFLSNPTTIVVPQKNPQALV